MVLVLLGVQFRSQKDKTDWRTLKSSSQHSTFVCLVSLILSFLTESAASLKKFSILGYSWSTSFGYPDWPSAPRWLAWTTAAGPSWRRWWPSSLLPEERPSQSWRSLSFTLTTKDLVSRLPFNLWPWCPLIQAFSLCLRLSWSILLPWLPFLCKVSFRNMQRKPLLVNVWRFIKFVHTLLSS